ncbi:DUF4145 domain-containing protein [Limimaricola pyoseonensis]|uniref:DUF4145 domain-containing protein n=1 Tax=Limimaricola pyoseonensis TaxID=521013 RepID=UPI0013F4D84D|nr:DUF4145 domain-containing protein [Limimaricola pyoseonensis]
MPIQVDLYPEMDSEFKVGALPDSVPAPLRKSLDDAIRAYNARIYGATTTSGRRTLEGIFKYMLPEEQRDTSLYKLIQAAGDNYDFKAPIDRLSNAVRKGGNLGAHFDPDKEADQVMARQTLDLLVYLIEYLYVLPKRIESLENAIEMPEVAIGEG